MRKLQITITTLCFFIISLTMLNAQVFKYDVQFTNPAKMETCLGDSVFTVKLTNIVLDTLNPDSITIKNGKLTLRFPTGFQYVIGSVVDTGGVTGVMEMDTTIPNIVQFKLPDTKAGQIVFVRIKVRALCAAKTFLATNGPDSILVKADITSHLGGQPQKRSNVFPLRAPTLTILSVTPALVTVPFGSKTRRVITVVNGGFGRLTNLTILDKHGPGINVFYTSKGTLMNISADSALIKIDTSVIKTVGNGDIFLDFNEQIVIIDSVQVVSCANRHSDIYAYWGCGSTVACETSNGIADVNITGVPVVHAWSPFSIKNCYSDTTRQPQMLYLKNVQYSNQAPAFNLRSAMDLRPNNGNAVTVDTASFYIQKGINGTKFRIFMDSIKMSPHTSASWNNAFQCFDGTGIPIYSLLYWHYAPISNFDPKDTLILTYDAFYCAGKGCDDPDNTDVSVIYSYATDPCGMPIQIRNTEHYLSETANLIEDLPASINYGDTTRLNFTSVSTYHYIQGLDYGPYKDGLAVDIRSAHPTKGMIEMVINLKGVTAIPNSFLWAGYNHLIGDYSRQIIPDSFSYIGNTLRYFFFYTNPYFKYYRDTVDIRGAMYARGNEMSFRVYPNCDTIPATVSMGFRIWKDRFTACSLPGNINDVSNCQTKYKIEINGGCGHGCPPGQLGLVYDNSRFIFQRQSVGLPDNNNDGFADSTGVLDYSKIRLDRVLVGDTLTFQMVGVVQTKIDTPSFSHAFFEINNVNYINFKNQMKVRIRDASSNTVYTCNADSAIHIGGNVWRFNLRPRILNLRGCGIPSNFKFEQGDSIMVFGTMVSIEPCGYSNANLLFTPRLYVSLDSTASTAGQKLCGTISKRINFYPTNFFMATSADNSWNGNLIFYNNCLPLPTNTRFQIFNSSHALPYEYKLIGNIDTIKVYKPKGLNYHFSRIAQPYYFNGVLVPIEPFSIIGDTITYVLHDSLFHNFRSATKLAKHEQALNEIWLYTYWTPNCSIQPDFYFDMNCPGAELYASTPGARPWLENNPVKMLYSVADFTFNSTFGKLGIPKCANSDYYPMKPPSTMTDLHCYFNTKTDYGQYNNLGPTQKANKGWTFIKRPKLTVSSLTPVAQGYTDTISWIIKVVESSHNPYNNTYATAPNTWLHFRYEGSGPGQINVFAVKDSAANAFIPINGDLFRLGEIPHSGTKFYKVFATFPGVCSLDSVRVYFSYDCPTYPANFASNTCPVQDTFLKMINVPAEVQIIGSKLQASDSLCTDVEYNLHMISSSFSTAYDPRIQLRLPIGVSIVPGSSFIKFSDTATVFKPITDPVLLGAQEYEYELRNYVTLINQKGLQGIPAYPNNVVRVKFKVRTDCNFISGTTVRVKVNAKNPCTNQVTSLVNLPPPQKITGVEPPYTTVVALNYDKELTPCNNATTIAFSLKNLGPATIPSGDSIIVELPQYVSFIPGSFIPGLNAGGINPLPSVRVVGGLTYLSWGVNTPIVKDDLLSLSFQVQGTTALECRPYTFSAFTVSKATARCVSSNSICNILVLTGENQFEIPVSKPTLSILNINATAKFLPPNMEQVTVSSKIMNNGQDINAPTPVDMKIYWDANNNGFIESTDSLLTTITYSSGVPMGGMVTLSKTFNVSAMQACPLIAKIDAASCLCGSEQKTTKNVPIQMVARMDTAICSNTSIRLSVDSMNGYTYTWIPSTGLSSSTAGNAVFSFNNPRTTDTMFTHILVVDRGICIDRDTVNTTIHPVVIANAGADKSICYGDTISLSSSGGVSYQWSPNLFIDNINSASPKVWPPDTMNYILTARSVFNCIGLDTVKVRVDAGPITTSNGMDTTICDGSPIKLNLASSRPPATFSWSGNGKSGTNNMILDTPMVNSTQTITYLARSFNGVCGGHFDTIRVNVVKPQANIANVGCLQNNTLADSTDDIITFDLNPTLVGISTGYTVSVNIGTISPITASYGSATTFTLQPGSAGGGDVMITITDNNKGTCVISDNILDPGHCFDLKVDLALRNELVPPSGPVMYGDTLTFDIWVFNQGNTPITNVHVKDFLPASLQFDASLNPGWNPNSLTELEYIITSTIGVGDSANIQIKLIVLPRISSDNDWIHYAEVTHVEDLAGNDFTPYDEDSQLNSNSIGEKLLLPGQTGDDDIETSVINGNEDDHDPAGIQVYDLAIRKTLISSSPFIPETNVDFNIEVINQGSIKAYNVSVIEYIPLGFTLNDADWNDIGGNKAEYNLSSIAGGQTVNIPITLYVGLTARGSEKNNVEIGHSEDSTGTTLIDIDSDNDTTNTNTNGEMSGTSVNDEIHGDGHQGGDEDDHDSEEYFVEVYDVALKIMNTAILPIQLGDTVPFVITVYNQGNVDVSEVTVVNHIPNGFEFIPSENPGWTYDVMTHIATYIYNTNTLTENTSTNISLNLRIISPANPTSDSWKNEAEIFSSRDGGGNLRVTDFDSDQDDDPNNDNEPTLAQNNIVNEDRKHNATEDEDDNDIDRISIIDFALIIETILPPSPPTYGDQIDFKISTFNQGSEGSTHRTIVNYLPPGYSFDIGMNPGWTQVGDKLYYTDTTDLDPDDTSEIILKLTLLMTSGGINNWTNYTEIETVWNSSGLDITNQDIDSENDSDTPGERTVLPGSSGDNNTSTSVIGGNEDDHDPAGLEIFDFALKLFRADPVAPIIGDTASYTIRIYNQGNQSGNNLVINNYIPEGLEFIAVNNPGWTYNSITRIATYFIPDTIQPGDSIDLNIDLRVISVLNPDSESWKNEGEISSIQDHKGNTITEDIDSYFNNNPDDDNDPTSSQDNEVNEDGKNDPGEDEDDNDTDNLTVIDLALKMIALPPVNYSYGDDIPFSISIYNQGSVQVNEVGIVNHLPVGYTFDPFLNLGWTQVGNDLYYTYSGSDLISGGNVDIPLILKLIMGDGGTDDWTNYAEIVTMKDTDNNDITDQDADSDNNSDTPSERSVKPGDSGDDVVDISTIGGNEDDHDPAEIDVYDLAMQIFQSNFVSIKLGDTMPFTIRIFNQGNGDVHDLEIVHYLPEGFDFIPAQNPGWMYDSITRKITFIVSDTIIAGDSLDIMVHLKVIPVDEPTNDSWKNEAEITGFKDENGIMRSEDIDSYFDQDPNNDNEPTKSQDNDVSGDHKKFVSDDEDDNDIDRLILIDHALIITAMQPVAPSYGDPVSFTVTVYNQGSLPSGERTIKIYLQDGYTFDPLSNPGWSISGNELTYVDANDLLPGDNSSITLQLDLSPSTNPVNGWIVFAEISNVKDILGIDITSLDADSNNDSDTPGEREVLPGSSGDDSILNSIFSANEDDHDPATIEVVDLALKTTLGPPGQFSYGDDVPFEIHLYNQGNVPITQLVIQSYVPSGYTFDPFLNPDWIFDGTKYVYTVNDTINPTDSLVIPLILTMIKTGGGIEDYTVYSEIGYMEDINGNNRSGDDADSVPGTDTPTERSTLPGDLNDDDISSTDKNGLEDDHDPAMVEIFDLALRKTVLTSSIVRTGDDVLFEIEVFNQGFVDAYNVVVNEDIPLGYVLSTSDGNGWNSIGGNKYQKTITYIPVGSSVRINILLSIVPGANLKNLTNVAEISSAEDEDGVTRVDVDSNPDQDGSNDGDPRDDLISDDNDEDDHDIAQPRIIDLALRKWIDQTKPLRVGDIVKFNLTIYNQGNTPTTKMVMVDYMNEAYYFDPNDNVGWEEVNNYLTYNKNDFLMPGDTQLICLYLTVSPKATGANIVNKAEIARMEDSQGKDMTLYDIDSKSDTDPENDAGGEMMGPSDDAINGNGLGPIGFGSADEDEDDSDVAFAILCQPTTCKGAINLSLDSLCGGMITPLMLLSPVTSPLNSYQIRIKDQWGNPHLNIFDKSDIGKKFSVTITDTLCYGNSCWSTVTVEDKLGPNIICENDTVSCLFAFDALHNIAVTDECSNYDSIMIDQIEFPTPCDSLYLKRVQQTWTAIDQWGNIGDTCTREILIRRIDFDDIYVEPSFEIDCDMVQYDSLGNIDVGPFGVPYLFIFPLSPGFYDECQFYIDFEDFDYGEINCVHKILRTWRIREWRCGDEIQRTWPQWITIIDTTGPEILFRPHDIHATTISNSCTARVPLPIIEAKDACHDIFRIDIVYPGGFIENFNGGAIELPVGDNEVIYKIYDKCYNLSSDTIIIDVKDETSPVAVCDRRTVTALNHHGEVWMPAEVLDDGSFDECKVDRFEVKRMDLNHCGTIGEDDWGPEVQFCCEDVGQEIMVGFKVIDHSGNEAVCMVLVEVQDKEGPQIICPPNITVECRYDIDLTNLDEFGVIRLDEAERKDIVIDSNYYHVFDTPHPRDGLAIDNCPPVITEEIDISGMDQCGNGVIIRFFTATDQQGSSAICAQLIEITSTGVFTEDDIEWPEDFDTTGICDSRLLIPELLSDTLIKQPRYSDDECSLIGLSYKDKVFPSTIPGEPCFKIFRTWKLIDWCNRNDNNEPQIFEHEQLIKVYNEVAPVIDRNLSNCRDTVICTYDEKCEPISVRFTAVSTDDCTPVSELLWRYKVDFNSDGSFDVNSSAINGNVASGTWPIGKHIFKWEVEDRCGNVDFCQFNFELRNCKSPTAYCLYGLATSVTPMDTTGDGIPDTEMTTVWARDFDQGSNHTCGYPLALSFSADTTDTSKTFDCDDVGDRVDIELWVTDINGNTSFCRTYILIQDSNSVDICNQASQEVVISGAIETFRSEKVEAVEVVLQKSNISNAKTNFDGQYTFEKMGSGGTYIIKPEKNDDWLNGITTADIVKIQRHILSADLFKTGYEMIAADVNRSKSITARDMSDLRKLILGVEREIAGNTSWRFIDATYQFGDMNTALNEVVPEAVDVPLLKKDMKANFIGVKVGDLNGSAKTRGVHGGIKVRDNNALKLYSTDQHMNAGQMYAMDIYLGENAHEFSGMQFSLQFDKSQVEVIDIYGNSALGCGSQNYSMRYINEGMVTFSWDGESRDNEKLLTLIVRSKTTNSLSNVFNLSSRITPVLAVEEVSGEETGIHWQIGEKLEDGLQFNVSQNEPNPWNRETTIDISLPQSGWVQLSIYDALGKVHYQTSEEMVKGLNEWKLDRNLFPQNGIYFFQVDYDNQTITRKMIISD